MKVLTTKIGKFLLNRKILNYKKVISLLPLKPLLLLRME